MELFITLAWCDECFYNPHILVRTAKSVSNEKIPLGVWSFIVGIFFRFWEFESSLWVKAHFCWKNILIGIYNMHSLFLNQRVLPFLNDVLMYHKVHFRGEIIQIEQCAHIWVIKPWYTFNTKKDIFLNNRLKIAIIYLIYLILSPCFIWSTFRNTNHGRENRRNNNFFLCVFPSMIS